MQEGEKEKRETGRLEERRDGAKWGENRSGDRPEREGRRRERSKRRERTGVSPGEIPREPGRKEEETRSRERRGGETEGERKGWRGDGKKKMRRE